MKPKHTPGPWKCEPLDRKGKVAIWNSRIKEEVISTDEALANARLIAAAPELYEAAKAMMIARSIAVSLGPTVDKELMELREQFFRAVPLIEKAIAKAEGKE